MTKIAISIITLLFGTICFARLAMSNENVNTKGYVDIKVESISIDTERLVESAETLSNSIKQLSQSIGKLATEGRAFEPKDREALLAATNSVNQASQSLRELAQQIPVTAQRISDNLPAAIENSQQSITQIAAGIESANQALIHMTESLPETLEQGEMLVDSLLDSALQKITFYALIILLLFLLAIGALIYYSHRTIIQPMLVLLQEFKVVPEQMAIMSQQMNQTSKNLLLLQSTDDVDD